MRGEKYRARAKKVQKLGRDGLVEQNKVTGEEHRVSQRTADVSFGPERIQDQELGRKPHHHRKQHRLIQNEQQSRRLEVQTPATPVSAPDAPERSAPAEINAEIQTAEAEVRPVIRDTRDVPVPSPHQEARQQSHYIREDPVRWQQAPPDKPTPKRWQENTRKSIAPASESANTREPPHQGRLQLEDADIPSLHEKTPRDHQRRFQTTTSRDSFHASPKERLTFERFEEGAETLPANEHRGELPPPADSVSTGEHIGHQPRQHSLKFEAADTPAADVSPESMTPSHRQQRRYEKSERRVEQASRRLDRAQKRLPAKHHAYLEKQFDGETGKVRHRLQFEKEVIPEGTKPALPRRAGGAAVRTVKTTAVLRAHQKLREVERDNSAVEAAHKGELIVERGTGQYLRWNRRRRRSKPYQNVRQASSRLMQQENRFMFQTVLRDHPELQKKSAVAKLMQRRKIKQRYAKAAREAQKSAQRAKKATENTEKTISNVVRFFTSHKIVLLIVGLLALIIVLLVSALSSCTGGFAGMGPATLATSYLASEEDICNSDLYYTELETDLQMDIDKTAANHPGYDEYRYNIGEISHDPYELMAYLTAAFDNFTFEQVKGEIERLFGEQYTLTRTPITETRYTEENEPYEWMILQTTLTVRPLSQIIAASLPSGERTERYGLYMQTYGNRQLYGNPFDRPWLAYISSYYGYRVHPVTGVKDLHRGIDIAFPQGIAIHAVQDGRVVSAGEAGNYGLCVVIEDDEGHQSRYAHCSSLSVSSGQEVHRGDVIGAVGSTGNSTGPHLHLEVKLNGEYLNPIYFVETGGSGGNALPGTSGGPEIPAYPGEPVNDATYAAMLEEAQKYLGMKYVWGGSSPTSGFDCSGYVSWVINHSGWDVGRRGAQGLYNLCTPVSAENAKPGDLIFFTKTYSTPNPVSHVGIYVGNGQMIRCGDPISYASINTSYWTQHFYGFGRLPG